MQYGSVLHYEIYYVYTRKSFKHFSTKQHFKSVSGLKILFTKHWYYQHMLKSLLRWYPTIIVNHLCQAVESHGWKR